MIELIEFLKIFCGTEPFPELYRAKKYKFNDNFFNKKDFRHIMLNLPVEVREINIAKYLTIS